MIRHARVDDLSAIHRLINAFAKEELMLPLSIGDLTERIRDFQMAEEEGTILGAVALHVVWEGLAEVRSLAVVPAAQGRGLGRDLVHAALADARALGASEVFTLTYVPEFFEKMGFTRVDRSTLPHKVWQECTRCTKFPDCGEIALLLPLTDA